MKTDVNNIIDKKIKNVYNLKTNEEYEKIEKGLSEEVIRRISREKEEPEWVLDIRLKALSVFNC